MKLFKGKIVPLPLPPHRKSGKLYRGSQEVKKKKTPCKGYSLLYLFIVTPFTDKSAKIIFLFTLPLENERL